MKNIYVYKRKDLESEKIADELCKKLASAGFNVQSSFSKDTDLTISVGGDGSFLKATKSTGFSNKPILGINTGHLGFFAELEAKELDKAVEICKSEQFMVQKHRTINSKVNSTSDDLILCPALNDVVIKSSNGRMVHLNLSIGENYIEKFIGDGILISSSAGSTAYNYSLGGSIVDPSLDLLQITPMAPINNTAYRCFTSSLLLPDHKTIVITSDKVFDATIVIDGEENIIEGFKKVSISLANEEIQIVRLPGYSFWNKVKSKFL